MLDRGLVGLGVLAAARDDGRAVRAQPRELDRATRWSARRPSRGRRPRPRRRRSRARRCRPRRPRSRPWVELAALARRQDAVEGPARLERPGVLEQLELQAAAGRPASRRRRRRPGAGYGVRGRGCVVRRPRGPPGPPGHRRTVPDERDPGTRHAAGASGSTGISAWRWRRDLNPRWTCAHKRFRGVLLRPLGHATAGRVHPRRWWARNGGEERPAGAEHSSASTPPTTSGRWLSRRSRTTSQSEPTAPALAS